MIGIGAGDVLEGEHDLMGVVELNYFLTMSLSLRTSMGSSYCMGFRWKSWRFGMRAHVVISSDYAAGEVDLWEGSSDNVLVLNLDVVRMVRIAKTLAGLANTRLDKDCYCGIRVRVENAESPRKHCTTQQVV